RHTRWPRDWSSDVCSSDLAVTPVCGEVGGDGFWQAERSCCWLCLFHIRVLSCGCVLFVLSNRWNCPTVNHKLAAGDGGSSVRCRSEERRVGKECRSRWWTY